MFFMDCVGESFVPSSESAKLASVQLWPEHLLSGRARTLEVFLWNMCFMWVLCSLFCGGSCYSVCYVLLVCLS